MVESFCTVIYIKKHDSGTTINKLRQCSRVSQCYWRSIFKYFSSFINPAGTLTLISSLISFSVSKTKWDQLPHLVLFSFSQWDLTNRATKRSICNSWGCNLIFFLSFWALIRGFPFKYLALFGRKIWLLMGD